MTKTFAPWLLCIGIGASACAAPQAVGADPNLTPAERDRLHADLPAPDVAPLSDLTATTVTGTFDAPVETVTGWFMDLPLADALPGTDAIPGVARTDRLTPGWGAAGDRRRVVLHDGGTALEEILVSDLPGRFRYVVWNYDTEAAAYVRYGVGEFRFTRAGERTEVRWTYGFAPRGWPASWLLGGFVRGDYRDFMEASMVAMTAACARSCGGTSRRRDTH